MEVVGGTALVGRPRSYLRLKLLSSGFNILWFLTQVQRRGSVILGPAWRGRPMRLGGNTGRVVRARQSSSLMGPPPPRVSEACTNYLHEHDSWGLNVFELDVISDYRPLLAITVHALKSRNLIETLKIDEVRTRQ